MLSTRYISSLFTCAVAVVARFASLALLLNIPFCVSYTYAQDTTNGIVWGPLQRISTDTTGGEPARVVSQGDTVHCVWEGSSIFYSRSTDGGATFSIPRNILTDTARFHPNGIYPLANRSLLFVFWSEVFTAGSRPDVIWMMKSTDRGDTWSSPFPTLDDSIAGIYSAPTITGDTIALLVASYNKDANGYVIQRSTDAGNSWSYARPHIPAGWYPSITLANNKLHMTKRWGYDFSEFEVMYMYSTNLGETWSDSVPISTIDNIYSGEPYISSDGASNFNISWKDTKYGCWGFVGCSILTRSSTDSGASWGEEIRLTTDPIGSISASAYAGNMLAVLWNTDSVDIIDASGRMSYDFGATWDSLMYIIPSRWFCMTSSYIYITAIQLDSGIGWQIYGIRGQFVTNSVTDITTGVKSFTLEQNYPNPFNPSTAISFQQSAVSHVTLKVYDIYGKEVAVLVNEKKEVGKYTAEWNAEGLASGMYFYRLATTDINGQTVSLTKKAIVMK
ncbi:MAG: exo-alpha-sialidase [Bacteroidota bacterium]